MTDPAAEQAQILPLFPLASVVLFPEVRVPLYIFEPRYRQMIATARRGNGRIGMVALVPDPRGAAHTDPAIFPIGCAGQIASHRQREDGSCDIVLAGIARFRIDRELDRPEGQLFRRAQVTTLDDDDSATNAREVDRLRAEVHRRYARLLKRVAPRTLEQFNGQSFAAISNAVYANTISLSLNVGCVEKQSLLEASSTATRLERLLAVLDFKLVDPLSRAPLDRTFVQ